MRYIFLVILMVVGGCLSAAQETDHKKISIADILKDDKIIPLMRGDRIKSVHHYSDRSKKQLLYEYDNLGAIATAKDADLSIEPKFKRILFKHGLIKQFEQPREQNGTLKKQNTATIKKFMALDKGNKFTPADLQSAIYNENIDAAKIILDLNPELLEQKDEKGLTPLALAMSLYKKGQEPSSNFTEFIQYLMELGANCSSLPTENISSKVANTVQVHEAQRKELLANIATSKKTYDQYKQFAGRAIILPKPHEQMKKSKPLQNLEETEKKYATTDLATLPTSEIAKTQAVYARAQEACFERPMETECPICSDKYETKTPVMVCTKKHTVCNSCFSVPALQSCPLCREKFSNNEKEFWKPVQLDFCQTCATEKDTLGFAFCSDCKHVGVVCADCKLVPCCKKPRIALSTSTINNVSTYSHGYIDHELKQREADRSLLDKSLGLQKQELERKAIEEQTNLKKRLERVRTKIHQLDGELTVSKASIDQARQNHEAWAAQVNTNLKIYGGSEYMCAYYKAEEAKRNAVRQQNIDQHNLLFEKFKRLGKKEEDFVDAYNRIHKNYHLSISGAESIYLARLQKRNNYAMELTQQLAKMWERN